MTEQPDLFTAIAARDQAIATVERAADDDWLVTAAACALGIAATKRPFTTDEIWDALDGFEVGTPEPRAMGAVIKSLSARGVIRPTGRYVQSTRGTNHARPVREWIAA